MLGRSIARGVRQGVIVECFEDPIADRLGVGLEVIEPPGNPPPRQGHGDQ